MATEKRKKGEAMLGCTPRLAIRGAIARIGSRFGMKLEEENKTAQTENNTVKGQAVSGGGKGPLTQFPQGGQCVTRKTH